MLNQGVANLGDENGTQLNLASEENFASQTNSRADVKSILENYESPLPGKSNSGMSPIIIGRKESISSPVSREIKMENLQIE